MKRLALILAVLLTTVSAGAAGKGDQGISLGFGMSHIEMGRLTYTTKNYAAASPLAYTPIEIGYRWSGGFMLLTGVQLFFYSEETPDVKEGAAGAPLVELNSLTTHEYEVTNFFIAGTYDVQLPLPIKPYVGGSVEVLSSTRKPVLQRLWDPNTSQWEPATRVLGKKAAQAWGMAGSSAILGLRWILNDQWSLHAEGRYLFPYGGEIPPLGSVGLGIKYLL